MAFSYSGGSGPGRGRFRGLSAMSDINIVPLVDVVMVLLVIFMLTAHVMEFGLEVEVPKVKQVKDSAEELPVVTVTKNGGLYLNDKEANINALTRLVRQQFPGAKAVYVRADKDAIWEVVAQPISVLGEAGMEVRVVTKPEDEAERPRRR